ncbi:MAG: saccharopine dehydrogenase NADP-binding domain-containing protein [Proteobacteria bacterium]|jgi:saccharopine dehydrogenase-like NADP-dependent oxidoreductase|nr:saccharopine dehydrogenase NADP-binding domain-containing protein [Pseudomonadota bacterium]
MKRVLVLGAGLVAKPLIDYFAEREGFALTVADIFVEKARALLAGRTGCAAVALDASRNDELAGLVASHDVAVSLLPAPMHPIVAALCLTHKKHMATASYVSQAMREMHADAAANDLVFVNECGVDPGLDHMSAMRVIHGATRRGGKIVSFRSYCGGLPAPEANTNPIGYKFSWAPRGVLVAATNPARFLRDGAVVEVPGTELFADPEPVEFPGAGSFEGYPNRDALPYIEMYGLDGVRTMFRGTLRHLGHCASWYHWVKLGLFDQRPRSDLAGLTYKRFMQGFVGGAGNLQKALSVALSVPESSPAISNLEWLGLFHESPVSISEGGNVDILASRMLEKCSFAPGERDLLIMRHEFEVEYPGKSERVASSLVAYGVPGGDSAMARTVSLPLAIAVRLIAEGAIPPPGVVTPVHPELYGPILDELARDFGIAFDEGVI